MNWCEAIYHLCGSSLWLSLDLSAEIFMCLVTGCCPRPHWDPTVSSCYAMSESYTGLKQPPPFTVSVSSWDRGLMGTAGSFCCPTWNPLGAVDIWRLTWAGTPQTARSHGWQASLSWAPTETNWVPTRTFSMWLAGAPSAGRWGFERMDSKKMEGKVQLS